MVGIYTGSYYSSPSSWTIPATTLYTRRVPRTVSTEPEISEPSRTSERIKYKKAIDELRRKYLTEFSNNGSLAGAFNVWFNRLISGGASFKKLDTFCRAAGVIFDNGLSIVTLDRIGELSLMWVQEGIDDEVFKAGIKLETDEIFQMKRIDDEAARKRHERFEKRNQETKKLVRGMWIRTALEGLVYGLGGAIAYALFG